MAQTLTVEGLSCVGSEKSVVEAPENVEEGERAEADDESGPGRVEGGADANDLRQGVEEAGYAASASRRDGR